MADGTQAPGHGALEEAAPAGTPPQARARYHEDEYGWLMEQAGLLRAGRLEEIDRASLVEFLTDMASTHRTAWQSALTVLLHHMLKALVQPERMTRSWLLTIRVQQRQARLLMEDNPGMRQYLPTLYAKAYADARGDASAETGIAIGRFPVDNPWALDDALAFVPPEPPPRRRRAARTG
jgi:hypothetical protein